MVAKCQIVVVEIRLEPWKLMVGLVSVVVLWAGQSAVEKVEANAVVDIVDFEVAIFRHSS